MPLEKNIGFAEIAKLLASGEENSQSVCSHFLTVVRERNPSLLAFLRLSEERIMKSAEASDKRRKSGKPLSAYDGIPIAIKENIVVEGEPCSCASKMLENFISPYDATVVKKLKSAGIIPFGRTNMDEFAMGSSCENSAFAKTTNPWGKNRVPGGSSGGSAVSVASSMVPVALGSDTGGSIRQPSAFCGVVGLKPSYGTVSRYGLVAFASSLDQIGPITNSVTDSAIVFDLISGRDPMDCTSLDSEKANFAELLANADSVAGLRIGISSECLNCEGVDDSIRKNFNDSVNMLKDLGASICRISLPHWKYSVSAYYVVATAEASANLAKFDGIRYGMRKSSDNLSDIYFKTRGAGFGEEVKRRILLGTFVLSGGYHDAYYLQAQKARTLIKKDYDEAFKICDVILTPVTPTSAFEFNSKSSPLQMYLSDIFTIPVNLVGNCAISVPSGLCPISGLPLGIQISAPFLKEDILFRTARVFEKKRPIKRFIAP